jgi:hypothetical protein
MRSPDGDTGASITIARTDSMNGNDPFRLRGSLLGLAGLLLAIVIIVDIVLRLREAGAVDRIASTVGHHHMMPDSTWYHIYTIVEEDGDIIQVWWDGSKWHRQGAINYRTGQPLGVPR